MTSPDVDGLVTALGRSAEAIGSAEQSMSAAVAAVERSFRIVLDVGGRNPGRTLNRSLADLETAIRQIRATATVTAGAKRDITSAIVHVQGDGSAAGGTSAVATSESGDRPAPAADQPNSSGKTELNFASMAELNEASEPPQPDAIYRAENLTFETDHLSHVIRATATNVQLSPADPRASLRRKIGNEGEQFDVGFHLIAHIFGGPTNRLNVVQGNGLRIPGAGPNLNQGEYAKMEREVRRAVSEGASVDLDVAVRYDAGASSRPTKFEATVTFDGFDKRYQFDNAKDDRS